jgi:ferredoxin-NADP reductase
VTLYAWLKRRTYGTVGYVSRTTGEAILKLGQELSLGKKYSSSRPVAVLVDTERPTVAGAGKHRGWDTARAIAERITTPLLPDDYLKLANPLWSARELRGRVLQVRRETVDSATLVIKPGWGFSFDYQPGQYIGIGLLIDGRWRWRSYSLTSSPVTGAARPATSGRASRTITITVKAMPEGFLSTHLVGGVAPGTIVRLAAPQGNFVMPDPAPASVLFITGGSGITPVMSMLRTLARRDLVTDIVHLHSAPTESDVMFAAELAELERAHDGYRLRLRSTRTEGRFDLARLDDELPDWRERQTWACGPEGMLNAAERVWHAEGTAERLHLERFAVSKAAVHGQGGTVEFARTGKRLTVDAATPLMDAGEQVGVQMPFGCRMGICQSCVVGLLEGHVRDLRTGAEHEPGSRIQTCISAASGDCVLDV